MLRQVKSATSSRDPTNLVNIHLGTRERCVQDVLLLGRKICLNICLDATKQKWLQYSVKGRNDMLAVRFAEQGFCCTWRFCVGRWKVKPGADKLLDQPVTRQSHTTEMIVSKHDRGILSNLLVGNYRGR